MSGFVSIVGAGLGAPDLLTLRAKRRLEEADSVLYDALIPRETLEHAPRARRIFVGKRAGRCSSRQEGIHGLLILLARRGERVVRLKGGDPFVLGRGGEEGLALSRAGVRFEVIPGVSSSIAAPALAGIPLTHRGVSSGFLVVAGHVEHVYRPILEGLAPHSVTIVVLMGLASRAVIARLLIERGWRSETPAAVVLAASTSEQASWTGTLDELGEAEIPTAAPGTLVIGEVVSLAATLAPMRSDHVLNR